MFVAVEQNNITSLNPDHHRQVAVEKQWQEGRSSLIYIEIYGHLILYDSSYHPSKSPFPITTEPSPLSFFKLSSFDS